MIRALILSTLLISFSFVSAIPKPNDIGSSNSKTKLINPYFSAGLGLDRALYVPALGIRIKNINAQFSVFNDLTASGMSAVEISADILKFSLKEKYNNKISIGLNYFNSISGDFAVNEVNIAGVLVGFNKYKVNGRHQIFFKLGAAYYEKHHSSIDLGTNEISNSFKQKIIPNLAIGYNLFLFRFRE